MNVFTRLFFVLLGFVGLYAFGINLMLSESLSVGQGFMLASIIPESLFFFVAACYTKKRHDEVLLVTALLIGTFFTLVSYGMYKQSDNQVYSVFAWLGLFLCGSSIVLMMRFPRRK